MGIGKKRYVHPLRHKQLSHGRKFGIARFGARCRRYLPYIELHVGLPFFDVSTAIMRENYGLGQLEITRIEIRLYKWSYRFKLYWKDVS